MQSGDTASAAATASAHPNGSHANKASTSMCASVSVGFTGRDRAASHGLDKDPVLSTGVRRDDTQPEAGGQYPITVRPYGMRTYSGRGSLRANISPSRVSSSPSPSGGPRAAGAMRGGLSEGSPRAKVRADGQKSHRRLSLRASQHKGPHEEAAHWTAQVERGEQLPNLIAVPDIAALELGQRHVPAVDVVEDGRDLHTSRILPVSSSCSIPKQVAVAVDDNALNYQSVQGRARPPAPVARGEQRGGRVEAAVCGHHREPAQGDPARIHDPDALRCHQPPIAVARFGFPGRGLSWHETDNAPVQNEKAQPLSPPLTPTYQQKPICRHGGFGTTRRSKQKPTQVKA